MHSDYYFRRSQQRLGKELDELLSELLLELTSIFVHSSTSI